MIDRAVRFKRRWRRKLSRTRWVARLLGRDLSAFHSDEPGLVIIQIDGFSRTQFERAIAEGHMPFLNKLVGLRHFEELSFYSGIPSTTPAVQAEVMYGVRCAVPAFQFLNRESGKTVLMYEQEWAKKISTQLAVDNQPLLEGGRSYANIYAAGAAEALFCAETMDLGKLTDMVRPSRLAIILVLYFFTILRIIGLAILELFISVGDMVRGLIGQQHWRAELRCVPSRIAVSIVMREWLRIMLKLGIQEGAPIIYGNFLGYDEQAHRRGPGSAFAHWGLKGIDNMIRDVFRTAQTSDLRDYEVIVFSDHGQQEAKIYENESGVTIQTAVTRAFSTGPLAGRGVRGLDDYGAHDVETDQRGRRLLRIKRGRHESPQATAEELANDIIVTALGPLGHVYLPTKLSDDELAEYARILVEAEKVPLVLFRNQRGILMAHNRDGVWRLPEDALHVFGADHPFIADVTLDLIRLAKHPDAGDVIISGWSNSTLPTTFVHENGAHGSIGPDETRGFALVPHSIHVQQRHGANNELYIRGLDLYRGAWQFVHPDRPLVHHQNDEPENQKPINSFETKPRSPATHGLRVMTYNVHSCIGIDGKVRPERIISVIRSSSADLIALQEVDSNRNRSRGHEQASVIAQALSMNYYYYAISDWDGEQYGLAIISRYPIEHLQSGYLTPVDHRHDSEARGALWVKIETDAGSVNVINTHFGLRREERSRQASILQSNDWLGKISDQEPIILCGDLNCGPASSVCHSFAPQLVDAHKQVRQRPTWGTFISVLPIRRLDYIFTSRHFTVDTVTHPRSPTARVASDHLPVCVQLSIPIQP